MSRNAHILATVLMVVAAGPAQAQPARRVVALAEPSPDEPATAELARALRPHLASADVTLRIVSAVPPGDDDLARAAWGAEIAAREDADAVLWLEPGEAGALTLRLVDARARLQRFSAPPGDRFDQVRTVALAARSHVARAVERVRREREADTAPAEPRAPPPPHAHARGVAVAPLGTLTLTGLASAAGLAAGARLEAGLRVGRLLEIRLGGAVLLPEDVTADNAGSAGTRLRVPAGLSVATVLPAGPLDIALGLEGLLGIAFLEDRGGATQTRVAPLLGVRVALRHRVSPDLFLEIPLSSRVRLAAPGSDATWSEDAVAPAFEVALGISAGLGG